MLEAVAGVLVGVTLGQRGSKDPSQPDDKMDVLPTFFQCYKSRGKLDIARWGVLPEKHKNGTSYF